MSRCLRCVPYAMNSMPTEPAVLALPPLLEALEAWRRRQDPEREDRLRAELDRLVRRAGFSGATLAIDAPPLADVELRTGRLAPGVADAGPAVDLELRPDPASQAIGRLRLAGVEGRAESAEGLANAIGLLVLAIRDRERARRAEGNLAALDTAVRGIAAELDLDRVLQVIVDRVRELVAADYAAVGIVDEHGMIELFITSGVSHETRELIGDPPRGHGLLGLIIREGRSIRIEDIATDPRRYGFPAHHPEMHPFLGVPVRSRDVTVGNLYLTNAVGGRTFSEDDEQLVERFALHAGIAIENARLHDRVQRLTIVEERERIGRELHDSIIQRLYGLNLSLDDVPDLVSEDPAEASARVDRAIETISGTIREIRTFIFGLRPIDVTEGGVVGALEQVAAEMSRIFGLDVALEIRLTSDPPMPVTAELLSVVREALTNVSRHAEATSALVALTEEDDGWRLEVADNGRGFEPEAPLRQGHHGIANMSERARKLGGTLKVASRHGHGTRIILGVPYGRDQREALSQ